LTTGTTYKFRVFSQNASGMSTASAAIDAATSTTNIPAPQNVLVSAPRATGATVTWDPVISPSAQAVTSYLVSAKLNSTGATVTQVATANSFTFTTLAAGSVYSVIVTAKIDQVLGVSSAPVSLTTASNIPSAPQSLRVGISGTNTYLQWNLPLSTGGSSITGYLVQKMASGSWVDFLNTGSRSALIPTLLVGQSDTYRVIARNANGLGEPSSPLVVAGRAALASAPLELAVTPIDANSRIVLSWKAPETDGGAPVTSYQVYVNKGSGTIWEALVSASTLTVQTFAPAKGATWRYRVAARNSVGIGAASAEVSVSTPKGVPGAPSAAVALTGTDEITLRWVAPADNGGELITGYLLEKTVDNVWTEVKTVASQERAYVEKRGGPGQRTSYRVTALNSLGASPTSQTVTIQVPYDKADAPIGVTATLDTSLTKVVVGWQAPEKTGGSAISNYYVQTSRDGLAWSSAGTATAAARTLSVAAPAKGTSAKYRVVAYTMAALGNYSAAVTVGVPTTVSGVPRSVSGSFASDGKLRVIWLAPTDNGGSPITGYTVERLVLGAWQQVATPTIAEFVIDKEQAGSVVELRISAQNAVGNSNPVTWKTNFPFVKSDPISNLTAQTAGASIQLAWSAPAFTGGTAITYYFVERSQDNGATWSALSYVRGSTRLVTPLPAKGKSYKFRVTPVTAFGKGPAVESEQISTALTVPSAPLVLSSGFDLEGNFKFNWRKPYDDGGTQITGYVIEKQIAGVWAKQAETAADITSISIARDLPGTAVTLRVVAVNSVGASAQSSNYSYRIPALQATAPRNVTVSAAGPSVVKVSWLAPESLGGSDLRQYQVQISRDNGTTWSAYYAGPTASSLTVSGPAKGLSWKYRVVAYTSGAGISQLSEVISFTNPLTVSSSVSYLNAYRTTNSVTINFRAPFDLGGYPTATYKVQKLVGTIWVDENPILQLDGLVMTRQLNLPAKGTTVYRVIAVNGSGESTPAQVSIRF
jgi:titin